MNHLWHFPLGVGAQRLSSLVVEGDDVPGLSGDELSSEVFLSPHIQLFALNQSCLLSLVQLPALQVPGGAATAGFKTPNSEVFLFCWGKVVLIPSMFWNGGKCVFLYEVPKREEGLSVTSFDLFICRWDSSWGISLESSHGTLPFFMPHQVNA